MTALASSGVSETITLASFPSKLLFRARNAREVAWKMKENNKHIILVLGLAALTAVAAAVLTCVLLMPKLMLGRRLNEILKDTYTYKAEASVAGVDMGILGDEFEGSITGSRSNDVIYGSISYKALSALKYMLKMMVKSCSTLRSFLRVR